MDFRVGILGGGGISETHARAALEIPGVQITAVYGQNVDRVAHLAKQYGGRAYGELEDFLQYGEMDVVLVGSPSGVHAKQAIAAARRGIHVLVEKPLDISTKRCDRLIAECERAGVKLGVFFQGRTAPEITWLKRQVDSGGLGDIFLATAQVKWYRPPEYYSASRWRGTWALDGGGALMNQGIHTLDLLLWFLGDVDRVSGRTRTALHQIEVEDTAQVLLEFSGGAMAMLEATTAAYPGFPRRIELTGTRGTAIIEHDQVISVDLTEPVSEPLPRESADNNASASSAVVSDVRGHRKVLEGFLSAIATGARPLCDGHDGRRSVEVVEAVYKSADAGVPVVLRGRNAKNG